MARLASGFAPRPRSAYRPAPGRVDRLSFVLWAHGPGRDGAPMFAFDDDGTASTLVAVWYADERGHALADRLEAVTVQRWDLTADEMEALAEHARTWPLGDRDLAVTVRGGRLDFAPRLVPLYRRALEAQTPRALAVLRSIQPEVDRLARQLTEAAA